jgi:hypothetical protein
VAVKGSFGRAALSAVLVLFGVAALVAWLVCSMTLRALEDGPAFASAASTIASSPTLRNEVATRASDQVLVKLAASGVDIEGLGLDRVIRSLTSAAVATPAFQAGLNKAAADAHDAILTQLRESNRRSAPVSVDVDVVALIGGTDTAVTSIIQGALGDKTVAVVPVQVATAQQFNDWRTAYRVATFGRSWFAIGGGALLLAGLLVSARRRWFLPTALLLLGLCAGGVALGLHTLESQPPGEAGDATSLVRDVITRVGVTDLVPAATTVAWAVLGGAVVLTFVFLASGGRRRAAKR